MPAWITEVGFDTYYEDWRFISLNTFISLWKKWDKNLLSPEYTPFFTNDLFLSHDWHKSILMKVAFVFEDLAIKKKMVH